MAREPNVFWKKTCRFLFRLWSTAIMLLLLLESQEAPTFGGPEG